LSPPILSFLLPIFFFFLPSSSPTSFSATISAAATAAASPTVAATSISPSPSCSRRRRRTRDRRLFGSSLFSVELSATATDERKPPLRLLYSSRFVKDKDGSTLAGARLRRGRDNDGRRIAPPLMVE
ncbi:hypothetical protein LINGRAHAP2_LOCUS14914, partial [Linum grandiflorum]